MPTAWMKAFSWFCVRQDGILCGVRSLALAILLVVSVLLSACNATEDRHFGLSRSSDGELVIWFIECYSIPEHVSLYSVEDVERQPPGEGRALWGIERVGNPGEFPTSLHVGGPPPLFYEETARLRSPLAETELLEISFGGGEAWYEELQFKMSELRTDRVLTFDRRIMPPEAFTSQRCEETS